MNKVNITLKGIMNKTNIIATVVIVAVAVSGGVAVMAINSKEPAHSMVKDEGLSDQQIRDGLSMDHMDMKMDDSAMSHDAMSKDGQ